MSHSQEFALSPTPLGLTSFILEVLKVGFEDDEVFPYVPGNPSESEISILDAIRFKADEIQNRPAIVSKRGPVQIIRHVFGDKQGVAKSGTVSFVMNFAGSFTIMCLSESPDESETIAEQVLLTLMCFQHFISADWNFLKFKATGIGETTPYEEYKEIFITPIGIDYEIARQWEIAQCSPILKKMGFFLNFRVTGSDKVESRELR